MDNPFKSLVFLDLETTDLPHRNPAITEISLVACSCENVENMPEQPLLPRVLHKLTICVNPRKRIAPEAVLLTGLDNFMLENERPLDSKTLILIDAFFDCLQEPIALVAHNGSNFDFPILAKGFKQHGRMLSVKCIDSLHIFKIIDDEADKLNAFLDSELEQIEKEDTESQAQAELMRVASQRSTSPDLFADDEIDDQVLSQISEKAEEMYRNESTPENKRMRMDVPPKLQRKPAGRGINKDRVTPRQLFQKRSYQLSQIYYRSFGAHPAKAHRAEEDCLILLKCVQFKSSQFLANLCNNSRDLVSYAK